MTSLEEGFSANIQIIGTTTTNGVTVQDPINFNLNLTGIRYEKSVLCSSVCNDKYRGGSS